MTSFISSKFDPKTDVDRPKVGDKVEDGRIIRKVDWLLLSDILKLESEGKEPEAVEGCKVLMKEHIYRSQVVWVVWVEDKI